MVNMEEYRYTMKMKEKWEIQRLPRITPHLQTQHHPFPRHQPPRVSSAEEKAAWTRQKDHHSPCPVVPDLNPY